MGAALADNPACNRRATFRAGLAAAAISPEVILKTPPAVNPVNAGAVAADALLQYRANGVQQAGGIFAAEQMGRGERVQAGKVQGFIGVDVAQSGDKRLVEQQGF